MILEVRLSNFYSIKDELELDLTAGSIKTKKAKALSSNIFSINEIDVLKSVAIYGANASGKSNIIKAIRFCCLMILNSHNHNENVSFNYKPYKFGGQTTPSNFFISFISEGIEYEYSFSILKNEILEEKLFYFPKGRRAKVFTRNEKLGFDKKAVYSFGQGVITKPMDVALNTSKKTLFLSRASQMDREIPKALFNYFNKSFMLGYVNMSNEQVIGLFKSYKKEILQALRIADSDIVDITYQTEKAKAYKVDFKVEANQPPSASADLEDVEHLKFLTFHRYSPKVPFDMETEESEGTKKLFNILLTVLDVIRNNKSMLIDEIETHLHYRIVHFIIDLFHKSDRSQLIFTTHNTKLLDMDLFRRDQICFVNKNGKGTSSLASLYDYKDYRENMDAEKGYLQGRFDGTPIIDDSLTEINKLIHGE
ncbi:AAA family ATPase [Carboxylicivirga marina]|uniref:ATP-binding protein n=1 Tax=Carboxylicivirga marina TaxID=2800988 RepID=A0ABS1HQV9_9BACT|nr:ATP-binding protein [Carboxylicivirga marina]MBK3520036.1 ATP-binding protein [Carboxylicivirga marina]